MAGKFRIGPYDPCPCGSGKKYKFCCGVAGRSKGRGKYPLGTLAQYGPDDKTVTKIAAAVFSREDAEPVLQRWVATNILASEKVAEEIKRFFASHGVKNVVASDGVMGCPHEEGEDFAVGSDCPFCPFWAGKQGSARREESDEREEGQRIVCGMAWYRAEDWGRLLEISADRAKLEQSHGEWLVHAQRALEEIRATGVEVGKVVVDLDELVAWCTRHNVAIDGSSRADFVSEKVREKDLSDGT